MPSITTWARLEPDPGTDIAEGYAARVHDPLWLLTRQWQVGEFQGEDTGTPVLARVRANTALLSRCHLGELPANTRTLASAYDPQVMPLEAMVERQRVRRALHRHVAHARVAHLGEGGVQRQRGGRGEGRFT